MKIKLLITIILFSFNCLAQLSPFEKSNKEATTTYKEAITFFQKLSKKYNKQAKLHSYGQSDFGLPLHLLVLSKEGIFNPKEIRKQNKITLLINNGIHPGEPEGIDASMLLARDLLKNNLLPKNAIICIIPIYNIGGSFNRSNTSRANQNGPLAYGFRGNSKNLNLNRDFIKTDSKNSATFQQIFNTWQPEVFIDTHTSNGADYQYTMTLIPTQKDKLNSLLSEYLNKDMLPNLYNVMKNKGYEMIPYVNSIKEIPDSGIVGFSDNPRYSTGYAALHNSLGFMPETHMLKPFSKRVDATYQLLQSYIDIMEKEAVKIKKNKLSADSIVKNQKTFVLDWKLNSSDVKEIEFKGFEAKYKTSKISGLNRLYYDRNAPYTKKIRYWDTFEPSITVDKPTAYYIPKAWDNIIRLLKLNNVKIYKLKEDVSIPLDMYYIQNYDTAKKPYEGHYIHSNVKLETKEQTIKCYKGDFIIFTNQKSNRYIIETLEPQAPDSFFNWNFFDSVLDQKEHFSPYVFEETASEILEKNPDLKSKLNQLKNQNSQLNKSAYAQLDFIYKNSEYQEATFMRYPIGRLTKNIKLNIE